jgi:hypothetical protein
LKLAIKCVILILDIASDNTSMSARVSGRGAVRLARMLWEHEVGGSNPLAPTKQVGIFTRGLSPRSLVDQAADF